MKTLEKTGGNKFLAFLKRAVRNQIFIPLAALLILVLFNLIADPSFFRSNMLRTAPAIW